MERGRVGGTCVIEGCTPTKTMIASARVAHLARRAGDYGVRVGPVSVDLETVRRRKRDIVDSFSSGSRRGMERHATLELILGTARFVGPREVEVALSAGGTRRLTAPRIFINTGTRTSVPPIPGLSEVPYLDSTSVMELADVPEHLVVLGGGFIGLEFGQMFRRFGAEVTIVEQAPRLVSREDEDVSEAVEEIFREDGVGVHAATQVVGLRRDGHGGISVRVRNGEGREEALGGSHLLVAAGRIPNSDDLGLEEAGVATGERGFIQVDERLETNVPGVYALGDVAGSPPFTHIAYDDYRIVRANLLEGGRRTRTTRLIPYTLFIDPQLARVGPTERELRADGREVRVARLPMERVPRAIETDETRGFLKAVVDADTRRILGATVLGAEGGEILSVLQVAMLADLPYTALRDGVFSHPTFSESLNGLFMTLE